MFLLVSAEGGLPGKYFEILNWEFVKTDISSEKDFWLSSCL